MSKRIAAEFIGTFWLVVGGCGSAVLAATFPNTGIGFLGVALAFGLTVLAMAYAIGPISGTDLDPAVSLGLWIGGRFKARDLPGYIIAQVVGGIVGAWALGQLWLFWVAPIVGALFAGLTYRFLFEEQPAAGA